MLLRPQYYTKIPSYETRSKQQLINILARALYNMNEERVEKGYEPLDNADLRQVLRAWNNMEDWIIRDKEKFFPGVRKRSFAPSIIRKMNMLYR